GGGVGRGGEGGGRKEVGGGGGREGVQELEALVGWPAEEEILGRSARLPDLLRDAVNSFVNARGEGVAQLTVCLIEQPEFRLAGAEEAVRQMVARMEAGLEPREPKYRDLARRAAQGYKPMPAVLRTLEKGAAARGRPPLAAADVVELLRSYARWRFESLVLQLVIGAYVSLRGQLSDQLREINFCRVRLGELLMGLAP